MSAEVDLAGLAADAGGLLLVDHALAPLAPGAHLAVSGRDPALAVHLRSWCRARGHTFIETSGGAARSGVVTKGRAENDRWVGATRAGSAERPGGQADLRWGLAARGALVEAGGPPLAVRWADRDHVWADIAPQLYAAAAAKQWDPAAAVRWEAAIETPPEIEAAVVQLMTYLVENEQAALVIPAKLLTRIHPHFREVVQLLATQAADEARHVEVFTRRARLHGQDLGSSTVSGRASLQTLLQEEDLVTAGFLLSVLGEGTFLDLLRFLHTHAPDDVTADVTRLALQDEARHVAFGTAHTAHAATRDPTYLARLRAAVERRHAALSATAGLNAEVHDALVLLAAGSWEPTAIAAGWQAVQSLQATMDEGRRRRLAHIGFPDDEAAALSALHTRNFM